MKNPFLLLLCVIGLNACQRPHTISVSPDGLLEKYISEYQEGFISVNDPFIIVFNKEIDLNVKDAGAIIQISPKTEGKAEILNPYSIRFVPAKPLIYNTTYFVSVELQRLFSVADKQDILRLSVQTRNLELMVSMDSEPRYTADFGVLQGRVQASDWISHDDVKSMIQLIGPGQMKWESREGGNIHVFSVHDIPRTTKAQNFSIAWNGGKKAPEFKGERRFEIPEKGLFKVLSVQPNRQTRSVVLQFSDAIDPAQRLDGLIQLEGYGKRLRFDVEYSILTINGTEALPENGNILISSSLKSTANKNISGDLLFSYSMEPVEPAVRMKGRGVVTPYDTDVLFPFEARGLHGVDVEIVKIFSNNVLQYLQSNKLYETGYHLKPVGRIIHQSKIILATQTSNPSYDEWNTYTLELSKMVSPDPGALYVVRIGFRRDYTDYPCDRGFSDGPLLVKEDPESIMRWPWNYEGYQYSQEKDPCFPVFYNYSRFVERNLLASNLGVMTKKGEDGKLTIWVNDINTLQPVNNASVQVFDFQKQILGSGQTNSSGNFSLTLPTRSSFIIVQKEKQYAYLDITDGTSQTLTDFDIGGSKKKEGLDGNIYGERGVWRPGDTMHLTFVLEDAQNKIPANHPVTLTITDARGNIKGNPKTMTKGMGGMYLFKIPTNEKDPTGNWRASIQIGDITFSRILKVETVKPNRLKIDMELEGVKDFTRSVRIPLQAHWLHGASGAGLKARTEVSFSAEKTYFDGYLSYTFDDPARSIESVPQVVYDDPLNDQGKGVVTLNRGSNFYPPGKVMAQFFNRVYEPGGDFSEDKINTLLSPYSTFTGIKIPESRWGQKTAGGAGQPIELIVLDQKGVPVPNRKISVGLYKTEWHWWYNRGYSNMYQYSSSDHYNAETTITLTTNQRGVVEYQPEKLSGYRYLIRACDPVSGHCSGEIFYTPWFDDDVTHQSSAHTLRLQADKSKYQTGENIELSIPSNAESKIFVSVEGGQSILYEKQWEGNAGFTKVNIPVTKEMAPNIYIYVTLLQRYDRAVSSLPLRMYGVLPLTIEDPSTRIHPIIKVADEIKPKSKYSIEVSEKDNQEMVYTLAVVDEGLLGLTRFETPDLHNHFYSKQSLGIKTWDMYDLVIRQGELPSGKLLSIGGDIEINRAVSEQKMGRFEPVVSVSGPFTLEKGKKNRHELEMPNYLGEVRVMVVARKERAYGNASKSIKVNHPIMVLPTAPRMLSPEEEFVLPVQVFTSKDQIKSVQVDVNVDGPIQWVGSTSQTVNFEKTGDKTLFFRLKTNPLTGVARINVQARSGSERIDQTLFIDVTDPNPPLTWADEKVLAAGSSIQIRPEKPGKANSHAGYVELSSFPPVSLQHRVEYLIQYPFGCLEQKISSAFPQLYLEHITTLKDEEKSKIQQHITNVIKDIQKYQTTIGALSYWPGHSGINEWASSYAGHFLIEARDIGFLVPSRILDQWAAYQKERAKAGSLIKGNEFEQMQQAYRLYTLVRYGQPDWASMNVLRSHHPANTALYILASAYAYAGQLNVAKAMIEKERLQIREYRELSQTFGSALRDKSLIADALMSSGLSSEWANVAALIREVAEDLRRDQYYNTQETSFALLALGKYLKNNPPGNIAATIRLGKDDQNISGELAYYKIPFTPNHQDSEIIEIKNLSSSTLYAKTVVTGKAEYESTPLLSENLYLDLSFIDLRGNRLDPASLKQGKDFIAVIKVTNPGSRAFELKEMALTMGIPSGWEIISGSGEENAGAVISDHWNYRDVRDDRVDIFFDMQNQKTFRIRMTATYSGRFYLPDIYCQAMYDLKIQARIPGKWVYVHREESI
ncbi:MAG TPA: MG2 domain-containing protein [Saprospiraceae bacterium]|nr:MG2 domain-containing protein [Saprospiraceae bacterium]